MVACLRLLGLEEFMFYLIYYLESIYLLMGYDWFGYLFILSCVWFVWFYIMLG